MSVFFLPNISLLIIVVTGRDIVFGVANRYGLDGPGADPGGSEIFLSRPT